MKSEHQRILQYCVILVITLKIRSSSGVMLCVASPKSSVVDEGVSTSSVEFLEPRVLMGPGFCWVFFFANACLKVSAFWLIHDLLIGNCSNHWLRCTSSPDKCVFF